MARVDNNNRLTPDAVQNYDLNPSATVVDKQSKYTPQLEEAAKLKATAQSLADLSKGLTSLNTLMARQAAEYNVEKYAESAEDTRKTFAEYSKNIDGFAKFNPFNEEVYYTLRGDTHVGNAILKYQELSKRCGDLTESAFDAELQTVQDELMTNLKAENIQAKNSYNALSRFQKAQSELKTAYVKNRAEKKYQVTQNQMVSYSALGLATHVAQGDSFLDGWNKTVSQLTGTANGLGMDNHKQYELLQRTVQQYLTDNIDEVDAEEFTLALGQTTINGQPLSDFDPNYTTSMKQLLMKAKNAKYEVDSMDLKLEKLRIEKNSLQAYADIYHTMADPNKTQAEKKQKAMELIELYDLEAVGFDFLHKIANDQKTLLTLETAQTDPRVYEKLIQSYIAGELSQDEVLAASKAGQLGANDAYSLFKSLRTDDRRDCTTKLTYLNKRYLADNPDVDLGVDEEGNSNQDKIRKAVFEITTDDNLTPAEKNRRLEDTARVAQLMEAQQERVSATNPMKLITAEYHKFQRVETQNAIDAQKSIAKLGLFKNQMDWNDTNITVSSTMQKERKVTIEDDKGNKKTVNRPHYGTDVETYLGRQIYAPFTGKVVASGFEASMGNYLLLERADGKGYMTLMHLQYANLPKAGANFIKGRPLAHVGNYGDVTTKDGVGILHVECWDKRMKLVNPEEFLKG